MSAEQIIRDTLVADATVLGICGDKIGGLYLDPTETHPSVTCELESSEEVTGLDGHTNLRGSMVNVECRSGDAIELETLVEAVIDALLAVEHATIGGKIAQAIDVERGPEDIHQEPTRGSGDPIFGKSIIFAVWHER